MVRIPAFHAGGPGSIPGVGRTILLNVRINGKLGAVSMQCTPIHVPGTQNITNFGFHIEFLETTDLASNNAPVSTMTIRASLILFLINHWYAAPGVGLIEMYSYCSRSVDVVAIVAVIHPEGPV